MKKHSTAQYLKVLLFTALIVCSFFVPMSAKTAKAEGVARAGSANVFNEQFTYYPRNWTVGNGSWAYGSGFLRGYGMYDDSGEIWYRAGYTNFEYQVRMRRVGCSDCSNSIKFRDIGSKSGYFGYTNSGYFYVMARFGSDWKVWRDWTRSSAISRGGFNVLRVSTAGNNYWFYTNNRLVAYVLKSGLSSGVVGIEHYSQTPSGNFIDVDWAVLR